MRWWYAIVLSPLIGTSNSFASATARSSAFLSAPVQATLPRAARRLLRRAEALRQDRNLLNMLEPRRRPRPSPGSRNRPIFGASTRSARRVPVKDRSKNLKKRSRAGSGPELLFDPADVNGRSGIEIARSRQSGFGQSRPQAPRPRRSALGRFRLFGGCSANHAFGSAGDTQSDPLPGMRRRQGRCRSSASRMPPCSRPSTTLRAAKTRCPSGLLDRRSARRLWNAQVGTKKRSVAA
jgi:hypothetical protein